MREILKPIVCFIGVFFALAAICIIQEALAYDWGNEEKAEEPKESVSITQMFANMAAGAAISGGTGSFAPGENTGGGIGRQEQLYVLI